MRTVGSLQKTLFTLFPKFQNFINMTRSWWNELEESDTPWPGKTEDDITEFCFVEWSTQNEYNIRRAVSVEKKAGLMPNFIHSQDGVVVQYALCKADDEDIFMLTVHDAFCSKITDGLRVAEIVVEGYQHMARNAYCPDVSEKWDFNVKADMVDNLTHAMVLGEPRTTTITH